MFEIFYLPMHAEMGVELPDTPAMLVSLPPRRVQRSRSHDVVSLFLTISGGNPPPARFVENMLEDTITQYYNSTGSITNGLRAAANHLNAQLLAYNTELREKQQDGPLVGLLNMTVLKGDLLSILHAGSTATWLLQPGQMQQFDNEDDHGKGLGINSTAPCRFFQASIVPDSLMVFCATPSTNWTELALTHGPRLTINLLRRRLLAADDEHFQAGILQLKPSDQWVVRHLRLRALSSTDSDGTETGSIAKVESMHLRTEQNVDAELAASKPEQQKQETVVLAQELSPTLAEKTTLTRRGSVREEPTLPKPEKKRSVKPPPDPAIELERSARRQANRKKLANSLQFWRKRQQKINTGTSTFFGRLLPGISDQSPKLGGGIMLLISVLVPLLVVFFAVSVYFDQGRDQQHKLYLDQARVYAAEARNAENSNVVRNNWQQTLYWLDLAESYQKSDSSRQLRSEAGVALDAMEGVERLAVKELYSYGFPDSLNFVQIAANDTEVYLLDSVQGSVLRLFLTGQGYILDETFSCGPGSSGTQIIGKLVDLITLPAGNPNKATVLAVDGTGNTVYCIPGAKAPLTSKLVTPEKGWGEIQAIALYQSTLYVLDAASGAVYYYPGFTAGYGDTVQTFFDPERDVTLPELINMIDLAANGEDLYLLNKNGSVAHCTSGIWEANQTRCDDPASFGDMRPIQTAETLLFSDTSFVQMQTSSQPEPSLFLLDSMAPAIYRFSLQLNLDRLFRPGNTSDIVLPKPPATAFSVSSFRQVFVAYGSQVYYASIAK